MPRDSFKYLNFHLFLTLELFSSEIQTLRSQFLLHVSTPETFSCEKKNPSGSYVGGALLSCYTGSLRLLVEHSGWQAGRECNRQKTLTVNRYGTFFVLT